MIVDSSAILAIMFAEADAHVFAEAMSEADSYKISAATFVEVAVVVVVEAQTQDRGSRQLTPSCAVPGLQLSRLRKNKHISRVRRTQISAKVAIQRDLISVTVFPTRSLRPPAKRYSSRAAILPRRVSLAFLADENLRFLMFALKPIRQGIYS